MPTEPLDADVIVVGCGPVGASLAALLGLRGVHVIVIDRDLDIYPLPRAAHIDHQGLRLLQEIGALPDLRSKMLLNSGIDFVTADRQTLIRIPASEESVSGLPASMYFHQPEFDRRLREAARQLETVHMTLGAEMVGMLQSLDQVAVTVRTTDGAYKTLTAQYVVGCDGAWSPTRETAGIHLDSLDFDERWLVLDLVLHDEVKALPDRAVSVCDPGRPLTAIPMPDGRFRIEFQLFPDEDSETVLRPDSVQGIIADWLPTDAATIERTAVYNFHGLVAQPWRSGRAIVAGDAAHQMPPFLGQGMCSGLRDAANLAWKLAQVINRGAPAALLDTYELERSPHVRKIVESAVAYGRITCITDREEAAKRDRQWLADPRSAVARLPFRLPSLKPGPLVHKGGGELFIQPEENGVLLDDVIGQGFLVLAADTDALGASAEWWSDQVGALVATVDALPSSHTLADWLEVRHARVAVVRPDRYVLATGRNLDDITGALPPILGAAEASSASLVSG
jgi:3-(3-hydroxy-phenyl)propionate hydroxylase